MVAHAHAAISNSTCMYYGRRCPDNPSLLINEGWISEGLLYFINLHIEMFKKVFLTVAETGGIKPTFQGLYNGEEMIIVCHSVTPPSWLKNDKNLPRHIKINDFSIKVSEVKLKDSGKYQCIGTTNSNTKFNATAHILVGGKYETHM